MPVLGIMQEVLERTAVVKRLAVAGGICGEKPEGSNSAGRENPELWSYPHGGSVPEKFLSLNPEVC
jgi:hypothetical protein